VVPNNPTYHLGLGACYARCGFPALAAKTFGDFIERWPNHKEIGEVTETYEQTRRGVEEIIREVGLPGDDPFETAQRHERIQVWLQDGDSARAIEAGSAFIQEFPRFLPVRNNLSLAHFISGDFERAAAAAEGVLEIEPENCHALSNLVRFLMISGETERARSMAERLRSAPTDGFDPWLKKIEAFAFIGDDEAILELSEEAMSHPDTVSNDGASRIRFFRAVAMLRQGREAEGRRLLEAVVKDAPWLTEARENLDDLRGPASERNGPWALAMQYWVPRRWFERIMLEINALGNRKSGSSGRGKEETAFDIVARYPVLAQLAEIFLERGDAKSRQFAGPWLAMSKNPRHIEKLKAFVFGRSGSLKARANAATLLMKGGHLPSGMTKMWNGEKESDFLMLNMEITDESDREFPRKYEARIQRAHDALAYGKYELAETLYDELLKIFPNDPRLLHNFSMTFRGRGEAEKADRIQARIREEFPDYFFARTDWANQLVTQRRFDEARAILAPLMEARKLHVSEFAALAESWIHLSWADGQKEAAKQWFGIFENACQGHPHLEKWRKTLFPPDIFSRVGSLLRG
jgi:tetratricopeptide (TPR) repeat protein